MISKLPEVDVFSWVTQPVLNCSLANIIPNNTRRKETASGNSIWSAMWPDLCLIKNNFRKRAKWQSIEWKNLIKQASNTKIKSSVQLVQFYFFHFSWLLIISHCCSSVVSVTNVCHAQNLLKFVMWFWVASCWPSENVILQYIKVLLMLILWFKMLIIGLPTNKAVDVLALLCWS